MLLIRCGWLMSLVVLVLCIRLSKCQEDGIPAGEGSTGDPATPTSDSESSSSDYSHGSICSYCVYAKFCDLCEKDCPCETSRYKPNCHMCKYCRYCYLTTVCDTICRPGGVIDKVSSALWTALPSWSKDEVESDIKTVKEYL